MGQRLNQWPDLIQTWYLGSLYYSLAKDFLYFGRLRNKGTLLRSGNTKFGFFRKRLQRFFQNFINGSFMQIPTICFIFISCWKLEEGYFMGALVHNFVFFSLLVYPISFKSYMRCPHTSLYRRTKTQNFSFPEKVCIDFFSNLIHRTKLKYLEWEKLPTVLISTKLCIISGTD